jgi:hypothetical protein
VIPELVEDIRAHADTAACSHSQKFWPQTAAAECVPYFTSTAVADTLLGSEADRLASNRESFCSPSASTSLEPVTCQPRRARRRARPRMTWGLHVLFDAVEDVRVRRPLPVRQVVPIRDVGRAARSTPGKVFDLELPLAQVAEGYKAPLRPSTGCQKPVAAVRYAVGDSPACGVWPRRPHASAARRRFRWRAARPGSGGEDRRRFVNGYLVIG